MGQKFANKTKLNISFRQASMFSCITTPKIDKMELNMSIGSIVSSQRTYTISPPKTGAVNVEKDNTPPGATVEYGRTVDTSISREQINFLNKLSVVDLTAAEAANFDPFAGLSDKAAKELNTIFGQIDKLFENAGTQALTADQEKQLTALEKKIDGILGIPDLEFDPFAGLSDKAAKELNTIFGQIDKLFENAGTQALTADQEKQLTALEKKINEILEVQKA